MITHFYRYVIVVGWGVLAEHRSLVLLVLEPVCGIVSVNVMRVVLRIRS
jgi:hypothetical protein